MSSRFEQFCGFVIFISYLQIRSTRIVDLISYFGNLCHLLVFSQTLLFTFFSIHRAEEPAADHGVSPLWELEGLPHQTQGPL